MPAGKGSDGYRSDEVFEDNLMFEGTMRCSLIKPVNGQNKFLHNGGRMDYGGSFIL